MTIEKTAVEANPYANPGLQPVFLPVDAWTEFSRSLADALADLEQRHASPRRLNPDRANSDADVA